jgi:hypothetical protein
MKPPAFASWLLVALAGERLAEVIAGDLEEEFALRDPRGASGWYLSQVLRSAIPLLSIRTPQTALTALLTVAMPVLLLDRLWSFIYSQIPLKDGLYRAPEFLIVNLILVCVCSVLSRSKPWAIFLAAALALWVSAGHAPLLYSILVLTLAPASAWRSR